MLNNISFQFDFFFLNKIKIFFVMLNLFFFKCFFLKWSSNQIKKSKKKNFSEYFIFSDFESLFFKV